MYSFYGHMSFYGGLKVLEWDFKLFIVSQAKECRAKWVEYTFLVMLYIYM